MNAGFKYLGNSFEIVDFQHFIDDELNDNPYNCSFDIKVVSGLFSGYASGCEYDYKQWKSLIQQLEAIYDFKSDSAEMLEIGYGSKVIFKSDKMGHISVFGKIFGEAMEQSLEFCFHIDQITLLRFIIELKKL